MRYLVLLVLILSGLGAVASEGVTLDAEAGAASCGADLAASAPTDTWIDSADGTASYKLILDHGPTPDSRAEFDLNLYWGRSPDAAVFNRVRMTNVDVEATYRTMLTLLVAKYPRLRNVDFSLCTSPDVFALRQRMRDGLSPRAAAERTAIHAALTAAGFAVTSVEMPKGPWTSKTVATLHAIRR